MPYVPGLGTISDQEYVDYEARAEAYRESCIQRSLARAKEDPFIPRPPSGTPEWNRVIRSEESLIDLANQVFQLAYEIENEPRPEWRAKHLQALRDFARREFERLEPLMSFDLYPITYKAGSIPRIDEDR